MISRLLALALVSSVFLPLTAVWLRWGRAKVPDLPHVCVSLCVFGIVSSVWSETGVCIQIVPTQGFDLSAMYLRVQCIVRKFIITVWGTEGSSHWHLSVLSVIYECYGWGEQVQFSTANATSCSSYVCWICMFFWVPVVKLIGQFAGISAFSAHHNKYPGIMQWSINENL